MDVLTAMATRRSTRKFKSDPIGEDKLARVLESLRLAPSGNNGQPVRFVLVKSPELKHQLVEQACNQEFIKDAPVIVVACCSKGNEFDAGIAMDHLTLAATAEGLGTCWVRWFDRNTAATILGVPDTHEAVVVMPMGYSDDEPVEKYRKCLEELVRNEKF